MKYLGPISDPKDIVNKEYVDNNASGHKELTQSEYDALSQAEKENGTVYFITDGEPDYTIINDSVPIGAVQAYAGAAVPYGWLLCDGSAVSRITYSDLFAAIGTTYGSGDGSTTFNLPDLKGRTLVGVGNSGATGSTNHTLGQKAGEETHTLTVDEMPSHNHKVMLDSDYSSGEDPHAGGRDHPNCAFITAGNWYGYEANEPSRTFTYMQFGYTKNTGNGSAHNLMQPYTVANYIIKALNTVSSSALEELDPQSIIFDLFYPVGSYYETSDSTFNPNVQWRGTWSKSTKNDDYVVDEGTSGIWTYRKWNSGIAECWGKWSGTATNYATPWSGAYGYYVTVPSPSGLFVSQPQTFYTSQISSAFTMSAADLGNDNLYSISVGVSGTNSIWHSIFRKGLWKTYTAPITKYNWHRTA